MIAMAVRSVSMATLKSPVVAPDTALLMALLATALFLFIRSSKSASVGLSLLLNLLLCPSCDEPAIAGFVCGLGGGRLGTGVGWLGNINGGGGIVGGIRGNGGAGCPRNWPGNGGNVFGNWGTKC